MPSVLNNGVGSSASSLGQPLDVLLLETSLVGSSVERILSQVSDRINSKDGETDGAHESGFDHLRELRLKYLSTNMKSSCNFVFSRLSLVLFIMTSNGLLPALAKLFLMGKRDNRLSATVRDDDDESEHRNLFGAAIVEAMLKEIQTSQALHRIYYAALPSALAEAPGDESNCLLEAILRVVLGTSRWSCNSFDQMAWRFSRPTPRKAEDRASFYDSEGSTMLDRVASEYYEDCQNWAEHESNCSANQPPSPDLTQRASSVPTSPTRGRHRRKSRIIHSRITSRPRAPVLRRYATSPDLALFHINTVVASMRDSLWWLGRHTVIETVADEEELGGGSSCGAVLDMEAAVVDLPKKNSIGRSAKGSKAALRARRKQIVIQKCTFQQAPLLPACFPDLEYKAMIWKKSSSVGCTLKIVRPGVVLISDEDNTTTYFPYSLITQATMSAVRYRFVFELDGAMKRSFVSEYASIMVEEVTSRRRYIDHLSTLNDAGDDTDNFGQTELHRAASGNDYKRVRYLLSRACNVNAMDRNGWTPLHCAASEGNLDVIWVMLQSSDVEVNALSKDGTSPLKYLLRLEYDDPSMQAKVTMMWNTVKERGASLSITDRNNSNLLHHSVMRLKKKAVEWLLLRGCDPCVPDGQGNTPLHLAARVDSPELIKILVLAGADVHQTSPEGTALDLANALQCPNAIQELKTILANVDEYIRMGREGRPNRMRARSYSRVLLPPPLTPPKGSSRSSTECGASLHYGPHNNSGRNNKTHERGPDSRWKISRPIKDGADKRLSRHAVSSLPSAKQILNPSPSTVTKLSEKKMVEYYNAKKLAPIDWVANEKNLIKLVKWIKEYSDPVNIAALTTLCQFAWPLESMAGLRTMIMEDAELKSKMWKQARAGRLFLHRIIEREEIDLGNLIGRGATAYVYEAVWNNQTVAVKMPAHPEDDDIMKDFCAEACVTSLVDSRHLLSCLGACLTGKDPFIVLSYYVRGTLSSLLYSPTVYVSWTRKLNIAAGIAKGMHELHRLSFIHRDLKSLNVLLSDRYRAVVMDFGESCLFDGSPLEPNVGTTAWIAPEVFGCEGTPTSYSQAADVYSFGILLYEIATRKQPFEGLKSWKIPDEVKSGARPQIPKNCPKQVAELIRGCWDPVPQKRPSFIYLSKRLKLLAKLFKKAN